jgi:hypothetical protein
VKRNLDLVREILIEVESKNDGRSLVFEAGQVSKEKWHHVQLALQAGLLREVGAVPSAQRKKVHLTWEGHDYLDAIRDEGIWAKTKAAVAETGGSATLEVIKAVAVGFVKKKISQHTGIEI